jgi:hypothetical protein
MIVKIRNREWEGREGERRWWWGFIKRQLLNSDSLDSLASR